MKSKYKITRRVAFLPRIYKLTKAFNSYTSSMKDIIRRIIAIVLPLAGIGTVARYMIHGISVLQDYIQPQQYAVLGWLWAVFLVFLFHFGILSLAAKWLKVRAVILWLIVVAMANYFLLNDASRGIYAADIVAVIGVLMVYLSLAGWIITKKTEQLVQESKQQIIEV